MSEPKEPFVRSEVVDEPGISGARWWQEAMHHGGSPENPSRRAALQILVAVGATLAVGGVAAGVAYAEEETEEQRRAAHSMQRDYGWAFGAATEGLVFDGITLQAFNRSDLAQLSADCAPVRVDLAPFALGTLFEAPSATPRITAAGDPQSFVKLADIVLPVNTPEMQAAYLRGEALADLFHTASGVPAAVAIVDLSGPESVAFAAGASSEFDPVFLFDNWPHPRAVVPAHQTLGALAFYQLLFRRTRATRPSHAPPLFVLDRNRLRAYVDDSTQFDNRHLAKLPSPLALGRLGIKRVLYIAPDAGAAELDDVNDSLSEYAAAALEVRMLAATDFSIATPEPGQPPVLPSPGTPQLGAYYGTSRMTHEYFWLDYPWARPTRGYTAHAPVPPGVRAWRPRVRPTAFSGSTYTPRQPPGFGTMPVVVLHSSGAILGASLSRSGSWTRSSGGPGG